MCTSIGAHTRACAGLYVCVFSNHIAAGAGAEEQRVDVSQGCSVAWLTGERCQHRMYLALSAAGETDRAKVEEVRGRLRTLCSIRWGNGGGLVFSVTWRRSHGPCLR